MNIEELEQRLTDLERRFFPIEQVVYSTNGEDIERYKREAIEKDGNTYNVSADIETNKGITTVKFQVKAWSEKQALFFANRDFIFPNMSRLQSAGKIQWFKTIKKSIF